jgi:hypothetical protein
MREKFGRSVLSGNALELVKDELLVALHNTFIFSKSVYELFYSADTVNAKLKSCLSSAGINLKW